MMKTSVSLYSYQEAYYTGKLDLEGCIREAAKAGSQGIELIAEQMPVGRRYPDVTADDVSRWFDWMQKYNVKPTCMDTFTDIMLYKNRFLTAKEQVQMFRRDLELAHKLGFFAIRVIHNIQPGVIEQALPIAADNDIKMCFEIHAPMRIRSRFIQEHVEMIERTGTKNYGFMPDFGIFPLPKNPMSPEAALASGVSQMAIDFAAKQKAEGPLRMDKLMRLQEDLKCSFEDFSYIMSVVDGEMDAPNDPEWLKDIAPYIYHVHAKVIEMNEDCTDATQDSASAIRMLKEIGYDGYLSTEYEGQRSTHAQDCKIVADEIEQVRRHQVMLHRLINE